MSLKEIYVFISILISFVRSAWFAEDQQPKIQLASLRAEQEYVELDGRDLKREFKVLSGKTLVVNLKTGGSIHVEGWNQQVVSIDAHIDGDPEDCKVFFQETDSGVEITSRYIHSTNYDAPNIDLEIHVPENFNLKLDSMGGDLSLQNIKGEFTGRTMGGGLELEKLKGNISLTTMGGEINLRDSELDGQVQTMGGDVTLENVIGDVKASSMGGEVRYENVQRRGEKSKSSEIEIHSMGGDLNVTDAPNGANLKTMGGDITVGKAGDHVKAETMGGDIELGAVDGWIQASTNGGDVVAKMVGNPKQGKRDVEISSSAGDIELRVPEGLSMNVDLQVSCTKHTHDCKIISDFPLQNEERQSSTDHWGHNQTKILAKGAIAGGANLIKIRTVNGNIVLKK